MREKPYLAPKPYSEKGIPELPEIQRQMEEYFTELVKRGLATREVGENGEITIRSPKGEVLFYQDINLEQRISDTMVEQRRRAIEQHEQRKIKSDIGNDDFLNSPANEKLDGQGH